MKRKPDQAAQGHEQRSQRKRRAEAFEAQAGFRKDVDFAYVEDLPKALQRMAAFWEYARESAVLCKDFLPITSNSGTEDSHLETLFHYTQILDPSEAMLLSHPAFPVASFKLFLENDGLGFQSIKNVDFPREAVWLCPVNSSYFDTMMKLNRDMLARIGFYGITIDWTRTDAEITEQFREILTIFRPSGSKPSTTRGRSGAGGSGGTRDMFNQLKAFRLQRAGRSFEDARGETVYSSVEGWRKAIQAAKDRISTMHQIGLFVRTRRN